MNLDQINSQRRRKGRPPLSESQASSAAASVPDGFDVNAFLVGLIISSADEPKTTSDPGTSTSNMDSSGTSDSGSSFSDSGSGGSPSDSGT